MLLRSLLSLAKQKWPKPTRQAKVYQARNSKENLLRRGGNLGLKSRVSGS